MGIGLAFGPVKVGCEGIFSQKFIFLLFSRAAKGDRCARCFPH
jgi:hypothetical protein